MSSTPIASKDISEVRLGRKRKRTEISILESRSDSREGIITRSKSASNIEKKDSLARRHSKRIIASNLRRDFKDDPNDSLSEKISQRKLPKKKKDLHRRKGKVKMRKKEDTGHKKVYRRRVVVIGAGISGLAAAKELVERNYDVLVLEARNRPGGRLKTVSIHLSNKSNDSKSTEENVCPTDVGGAFIHGIHKNPVYNLTHRLGITTRAMNTGSTHTLLLQYDNAGWPVRAEIDAKVQARFNCILEEALKYVQKVLQLQQRSKDKSPNIENVTIGSNNISTEISNKQNTNDNEQNHKNLVEKQLILTPNTPFGTLFYYLASIGDLKKNHPNIKIQISGKTEQEYGPKDVYSSSNNHYSMEDSLFQWHLANLELSSGTTLGNLGLQWNEDEPYGFNGHHVILKEGFSALIEGLINSRKNKKIFIKYGIEVAQIRILPNKNVEIVTTKGLGFQANHVICTLPLGVLAIPKGKIGHVAFDPPLSNKKQVAIKRLGFGHYNKCVLSFPRVFWMDDDFIGVIKSPVAGTNILIKNIHVLQSFPILVFIFGGTFAKDMEDLSDISIVSECMDVLQRISRKKEIPPPIDYVVTRWGKDRYARGAFSYIPPGVNGFQEYTALSEPIYDNDLIEKKDDVFAQKNNPILTRSKTNEMKNKKDLSSKSKIPLILFAGEATTPFHPSTIHGAYLSGIREAYRLDLCLEPELNNQVEFDNTFLYKQTFTVKCPKKASSKKKDHNNTNEMKNGNYGKHTPAKNNGFVSQFGHNSVHQSHNSVRNRLKQRNKNDSLLPIRKSQRSIANDKRIFYGDLDSGMSFLSNSSTDDNSFHDNNHCNTLNNESQTKYPRFRQTRAFSDDEDLALLRGVDTFGSDENGLKEIQSKSFPVYNNLLEEKRALKSLQSLKDRYGQLARSESDKKPSKGNQCDRFEEIKQHWMAPNGSGCWLTHITPTSVDHKKSTSVQGLQIFPQDKTSVRRSGRKTTPKAIFDI